MKGYPSSCKRICLLLLNILIFFMYFHSFIYGVYYGTSVHMLNVLISIVLPLFRLAPNTVYFLTLLLYKGSMKGNPSL